MNSSFSLSLHHVYIFLPACLLFDRCRKSERCSRAGATTSTWLNASLSEGPSAGKRSFGATMRPSFKKVHMCFPSSFLVLSLEYRDGFEEKKLT